MPLQLKIALVGIILAAPFIFFQTESDYESSDTMCFGSLKGETVQMSSHNPAAYGCIETSKQEVTFATGRVLVMFCVVFFYSGCFLTLYRKYTIHIEGAKA